MSAQDPYYKTVTRARLTVSGYARVNSPDDIPNDVIAYFCAYFGYFYDEPESDPSNFIIEFDQNRSELLRLKGNVSMKNKKYEDALQQYTEALSHNPNDVKIRCNRSLCHIKLNQFNRALNDSVRAVVTDPCSYKAWLRMAQSFESMKKYSECINIIEHVTGISKWINKSDLEVKLLTKYKISIENKSELQNTDFDSKSHVFDKDREQWKGLLGRMNEDQMNDKKLLDAPAFQIRFYSKSIIPIALRRKHWKASDIFERKTAKSDFNQWMNRKWVRKLHLHERINQCKSVTKLETGINNGAIPRVLSEHWIITWTASETLYLNKRCFSVTIHRCNKPVNWIFAEDTYGVPTAMFMINCLKKAMFSPSDAIEQNANRVREYGKNTDRMIPFGVIPAQINVSWRAKNEFDEISSEMRRFGIICYLESHEDSVSASKTWQTNPFGWNYLDLDTEPKYKYDIDEDSSCIELLRMDVMRYKN